MSFIHESFRGNMAACFVKSDESAAVPLRTSHRQRVPFGQKWQTRWKPWGVLIKSPALQSFGDRGEDKNHIHMEERFPQGSINVGRVGSLQEDCEGRRPAEGGAAAGTLLH